MISKENFEQQKNEREGMIKLNNNGDKMKIIEYNGYDNIVVEFQDEWKRTVKTKFCHFENGAVRNPYNLEGRLGMKKYNCQGSEMEIIEYINTSNITVKFNDENGYVVKTRWSNFIKGEITNPFFPDIYNVGVVGNKYPIIKDGKHIKEYQTWHSVLTRSFNQKEKERHPTYKDVTCCKEWLYFPNFYEWLHSQENFEKWLVGEQWAIDKDFIHKGNKVYAPENCSLVSQEVNSLLCKADAIRGNFPIGVTQTKSGKYRAQLSTKQGRKFYELRDTPEEAFYDYKYEKEKYIKKIAIEEYRQGNITKRCYDAMMNYQVEITD